MNQSESIGQLAASLAAAQGEFPVIPRDKTVSVRTRQGGTYVFSYAPLETILAKVRPALAKNGLALFQTIDHMDDGRQQVVTRLAHQSGEFVSCAVPVLVQESGAQAYGSAMTYARRYGITALLCIAADDDDDANLAEGNVAQATDKPSKPAKPKPQQPHQEPTIDAEALRALLVLAESTGTDAAAFSQWLGVGSLEQLPAARLEHARAALIKKQQRMAAAETTEGAQ